MPGQHPSRRGDRVRRDLAEADLDAAFALLYFAETQSMAGSYAEAYRALEDAEAACSDGQCRMHVLEHQEVRRVRVQLQRMRELIVGMKARLKAA